MTMRVPLYGMYALLLLVLAPALPSRSADLPAQEKRYGLEVSTPEAEGLDTAKLRRLTERAQETNSSALVVLKNGKLVLEWYGLVRQQIEAMSVTKSVVSMLVGQLIDSKKLDLDTPVSAFYPEWKEGRAAKVTVRHLLSQTSGLHSDPTTEKIYASRDFVKFALNSSIDREPGSFFVYNNAALNLLAGVAGKAAGTRLDQFARTSLFEPLGITEFSWSLDDAGNPHGMSGLQIHAVDLAKLGQLMLNGGVWNGKRLLSNEWVAQSVAPGQPFQATYGLLWWLYYDRGALKYLIDRPLLDQWTARGVPEEHVKQFSQMADTLMTPREYNTRVAAMLPGEKYQQFRELLVQHGVMAFRFKTGKQIAYFGNGYLGQYIVVYPEHQLVVVRQIHYSKHQNQSDSFTDFMDFVHALTQP